MRYRCDSRRTVLVRAPTHGFVFMTLLSAPYKHGCGETAGAAARRPSLATSQSQPLTACGGARPTLPPRCELFDPDTHDPFLHPSST